MIQDFSYNLIWVRLKSPERIFAAIYGLVFMSLSLFYVYMSSSDYESIDTVPDIFEL